MRHIIAQNAENETYEHKNVCADGTWVPKKGVRVRARTATGEFVVRRVWAVGDRVVYLCSERQFVLLKGGSQMVPAIGFPKRDVFKMSSEEPEAAEA
jgi:hypothetical protein